MGDLCAGRGVTADPATPSVVSRATGDHAQRRGGVDLYWLPLGAGGSLVRINGRIFERAASLIGHRAAFDLYHAALEVRSLDALFVIEMTPAGPGDGTGRGVVAAGPVGACWAGRWRVFRYELRCWADGAIPDIAHAVESPVRLTSDPVHGQRLIAQLAYIPTPVWGRDEFGTGEMWNSNSFIAWLIERSGINAALIDPPAGGRAPGWRAGIVEARRNGTAGHLSRRPERTF
jgi:hypothetical protein